MIDLLKSELMTILDDKKVSLVMFCLDDGRILWHHGRPISGDTVFTGHGFPAGLIKRAIIDKTRIVDNNQLVMFGDGQISESARKMMLRHVLIYPVDGVFLYIDSGCLMKFSDREVEQIQILASLLQKSFRRITSSRQDADHAPDSISSRIRQLLLRFSIEDECVLLSGETGSGKTHLAEQIHRHSGRPGPFVVCDTTTLNQELMESELFGHKKGAFTGAFSDKKGLVNLAESGTLFLDEIAEIPLSFQVRLLRFIETKRYRILGDPQEYRADVRLLAASNRNLKQMVADQTFREDLYYRLNIFSISLPPLRERKDEIRRLVLENAQYLKGKEPGDGFWQALEAYDWPGNIRELKTVIKRLGVLCDSPISGTDVERILSDDAQQTNTTVTADLPAAPASASNNDLIQTIWKRFEAGEDFWQVIKKPFLERDLSRQDVKTVLNEAMSRCRYKYVNCLPLLNLNPSDYKPFMKFLIRNRLNDQ